MVGRVLGGGGEDGRMGRRKGGGVGGRVVGRGEGTQRTSCLYQLHAFGVGGCKALDMA